jgi:hypothetical protein
MVELPIVGKGIDEIIKMKETIVYMKQMML